jgi:hypothetical protein
MGSAAQKRAADPFPAQRRNERDPVMIPPPPRRRIPLAGGLRLRQHPDCGAVEEVIPTFFHRRALIVEPRRLSVPNEALETLLPEIPVADHRPRQIFPQLVPEDLQRESLVNPVKNKRRRLIDPIPKSTVRGAFPGLGIRVADQRLRDDGRNHPP